MNLGLLGMVPQESNSQPGHEAPDGNDQPKDLGSASSRNDNKRSPGPTEHERRVGISGHLLVTHAFCHQF